MDEALSSSVDALQVGTQGYKHHIAGDIEGAIPYYKRALELDPNLAPTYEGLALAYDQIGEWRLAQSAYTKAYELRTRMTEPSRLEVEYLYYAYATGEREKALSVVTQTVQTFPRNVYARMNLAGCLEYLGQPARAVDEMREAARLQPTALSYSWLASYSIHAEMLDEARAVLDDAIARKLDSTELQMDRIRLAFLQNDQRTMQQFWNQTASRRDAYLILFMRSDVEEYYGRFRRGRELNQQALRMAPAAEWRREVVLLEAEPRDALWAAETGDSTQSREITAAALARVTNRDQRAALALAAARAGDIELARQLADALAREASANTLIQNYHLPTIRAAIKLEENDPTGVIAALRPSLKYELSMNDSFNGLYPAYLRGLAYLQLGNGRLAAAEFQKLMDHKGLVGRDVIGALAYLQMARAQKMTGDEASARKWYEQFLALWKDADPNIPILKQAKAEYARLPK
jgi:tetratricopeptide (TPR) repeat protein